MVVREPWSQRAMVVVGLIGRWLLCCQHWALLMLLGSSSATTTAAAAAPPTTTSTSSSGWPTVGIWNGSLPALPQTSAGNLPHSPMLGNGYMGVQLATARASDSIVNTSTRGPAAPQGSSLHLYIGSNAMWGVYPATKPALGPTAKATRRAVGGVSLSGLDALLGPPGAAGAAFSAEQRIMDGELRTIAHSSSGTFTTVTKIGPRANVLTLTCSWVPSASSAAAAPVNLTLGVWALNRYLGTPPGQHAPAVLPTTATVLDTSTLVATREAVPTGIDSPRRIKVALAVAVKSLTIVAASSAQASGTDPVSAATGYMRLDRASRSTFTIVAAMADNLHTPAADTTSLGAVAAKLARDTDPSALAAEAVEWWAKFWARSFVHLPTEVAVEALWNGAQYILACSASADVDPSTPAPGLGGPFVTSDNSGWCVRALTAKRLCCYYYAAAREKVPSS